MQNNTLPNFKAWDATRKEWIDYGFCLRFDANGNCEVLNAFAQPFKSKEIVLVRWTGLKDKHKTDIYEGDIVRYTHPAEYDLLSFTTTATVVWDEGTAGFGLGHISHRLTIDDEVEVIGNRFEHEYLLEDQ